MIQSIKKMIYSFEIENFYNLIPDFSVLWYSYELNPSLFSISVLPQEDVFMVRYATPLDDRTYLFRGSWERYSK